MYLIAKLLKALHSASAPWQLAIGFALGMIVGLTPLLRLHNIAIIFFVCILQINLTAFLLSVTAFTLIAYLFDPAMVTIGEYLLTHESLSGLWSALYSTGLGRISQFNHTLTLGSLVVALCLFPVMLLASKWAIDNYRVRFMAWIDQLKLIQFLKSSRIYSLYQKMEG